ncbi:hypothetical protein D3C81_1478500 [compost metagenome]
MGLAADEDNLFPVQLGGTERALGGAAVDIHSARVSLLRFNRDDIRTFRVQPGEVEPHSIKERIMGSGYRMAANDVPPVFRG